MKAELQKKVEYNYYIQGISSLLHERTHQNNALKYAKVKTEYRTLGSFCHATYHISAFYYQICVKTHQSGQFYLNYVYFFQFLPQHIYLYHLTVFLFSNKNQKYQQNNIDIYRYIFCNILSTNKNKFDVIDVNEKNNEYPSSLIQTKRRYPQEWEGDLEINSVVCIYSFCLKCHSGLYS